MAASVSPLDVDSSLAQQFDGHLAILPDQDGNLGIADMDRPDVRQSFQPQSAGNLSLGLRTGAVWVHFVLRNSTQTPQQRWLVLENPFLAPVSLYLTDGNGSRQVFHSGSNVPIVERPVPMRKLAFPVDLPASTTLNGYVKLSSPSFLLSSFSLWQPAAYSDEETWRISVRLSVLAVSVAVIFLFSILIWRSRGLWTHLAVGLGNACFAGAAMMLDGFGVALFAQSSPTLALNVFRALLALGLFCHMLFARWFLDFGNTWPRLAWAVQSLAGVSLGLTVIQFFAVSMPFLGLQALLALVVVMIIVIAMAAWQNVPNARLYLLAWGGLFGELMAYLFKTILAWSTLWVSPELPLHIGFTLTAIVLGYAIHRDARRVAETSRQAESSLREFQQEEQLRLTAAVDERTQELQVAKQQAEAAS